MLGLVSTRLDSLVRRFDGFDEFGLGVCPFRQFENALALLSNVLFNIYTAYIINIMEVTLTYRSIVLEGEARVPYYSIHPPVGSRTPAEE